MLTPYLSQVLGAGFARFMRLENPKGQLYEFLKNLPNALQEELQPRLAFGDMQSYKKLSEANVYDFASLLIRSGQMTQEVSNVASLLPQLEQRAKQAQELLGKELREQAQRPLEDLLDPRKPLRKAKPEEITPELLERVKATNAKIWVGDLTNPQILEHLGMDTQTPMMFIADGNALTHIEKRHGLNAPLVKSSGQPAITHEDIANYPDIVNSADLMKIEKYNDLTTIKIGKQINGYTIVVEVVGKKNNRLALKTMYKEHGKLEQGLDFRDGNYIRLSQR
ncbi:PBECR3 domain-containing polyvalent protein [Helicobacter salomonis]|uniref:PBECR3 domain-containing polyvalent protein n=1 Tax=Helicobacter salomonis TaxID=56878 RepID=UPI000CF06A8B|nr:hypothetical protein [Helicobacter salomonis]